MIAHKRTRLAECVQTSRISAPCWSCGAWSDVVHLYGDLPTMYCQQCCPECKQCVASKETIA